MTDKVSCLIYTLKLFVVILLFCAITIFLSFKFLLPVSKAVLVSNNISTVQVVIDAGHGGRDGGAVSKSGILEKDLNLSVSSTLNDILRLCGIKTVMTRQDDSLVCDENDPSLKGKIKLTDLKNRLNIAKENPGAVFISVHMNNFPVEKYKGLQVYFSPNNESSFELAKQIQENVCSVLQKDNNRKVKKAGSSIFLLDRITSPAVLIECGFLSNPEEAGKLGDLSYQTQLSLLFARCIMENSKQIGNN